MAKTDNAHERYDADQIQVLKGLEAVRKRPGMYIGSTSERGLHHLVYEVVDNSIDEALAGYADRIAVTIHRRQLGHGRGQRPRHPGRRAPDGEDPGRRVGDDRPARRRQVRQEHYKVSGGLHGVGVSVVNALSEQLKVWVKRDGKEHYMDFARGETKTRAQSARQSRDAGHGDDRMVQTRRVDLHGPGLQVRLAGAAAARAVVPEQGRHDHAHRRA